MMQTTSRFIYVTLLGLIFTGFLNAQNGSWWHPDNPFVGDTLTIYFDPSQNGEIPDNPSSLVLHWGVNETGTGNWQAPPEQLRPPGTVMDGIARPNTIYIGNRRCLVGSNPHRYYLANSPLCCQYRNPFQSRFQLGT